jgi:hypothetical protein
VAKKKHEQQFKFSSANIIRLAIFSVVIYFLINFLSAQGQSSVLSSTDSIGSTPDTLGGMVAQIDITQYLPDYLSQRLNDLPKSSAIIYLQDQLNKYSSELNGFPQKQINDLKLQIINQLYQDAVKSINDP